MFTGSVTRVRAEECLRIYKDCARESCALVERISGYPCVINVELNHHSVPTVSNRFCSYDGSVILGLDVGWLWSRKDRSV